MLSKEQSSWIFSFTGVDVDAAAGAVKMAIQSPPGSAMLPDCKPVKGKVQGPAEHLLCATHGHVLDIKEKKIIANSLEEYKSQNMGSAKPEHAAHPAQGAPPPPPATATPAPAPSNATASSADADAAKAGAKAAAEAKQLLGSMQSEMEDIASVQADYEKLAGGSRLNRAVSWTSDLFGGADDPGDDLGEIAGQIAMEHMMGMAAVGTLDLGAAHKHLAAMQALTQKAHVLWQNYSGDTSKGAGRMVTGLSAVSKVGDAATTGLSVFAPGIGKALSVAKHGAVAASEYHFGEKVNWTNFTIDIAFDLIGGKGSQTEKLTKKLAGPLAKKLAPKLAEAIAKKWGLDAVAKKLGAEVTEDAIEEYVLGYAEDKIKEHVKDIVKEDVEKVVEAAKDTDVTHEQLTDLMLKSLADPSGQFASRMSDKLVAEFKPGV